MITFKIDAREHKLKSILMQSIDCEESLTFLSVECDNLYCGDFVIEIDNNPIIVIERKTLNDLVSSIRDKRYKIQKIKLKETYPSSSIIYLIEGAFDYNPSIPLYIDGMDKYSVISSIINTQVRDNIHIVNTKNLEDTFDFLLALLIRICKNTKQYEDNNNEDKNKVKKEDFIKKHKITSKQDMFFYQLTQVPGISAKTAQAFVNIYGNMLEFYKVFTSMNNEEKLKQLKSITIDDNNKPRKINSKVAEAIVQYMF